MDEDFAMVVDLVTKVVVLSYINSKECGLTEAESMAVASVVVSKLLDIGFHN